MLGNAQTDSKHTAPQLDSFSLDKSLSALIDARISALLNDEKTFELIKSRLRIPEPEDELLDTNQACAFLHISRGTLNTRIQRGEIIPETPKSGKRNLFSKKHLRDSIRQKQKPKTI